MFLGSADEMGACIVVSPDEGFYESIDLSVERLVEANKSLKAISAIRR